jgi:Putative GTPase activating protein for Arf
MTSASAASTIHEGYNAFGDEFAASSSSSSVTAPLSRRQPQQQQAPSPHQMTTAVFDELKQLAGNKQCVDCGEPAPDWGSPKLGILMCFQCSGVHRGLGVHLSFVRSVRMDHWTDDQVALMRVGGNDNGNAFLTQHGIVEAIVSSTTTSTTSQEIDDATRRRLIQAKYDSDAALLYQQVLKAKVEGIPIPTKLAEVVKRDTVPRPMRQMEGFYSAPRPAPPAPVLLSTTTGVAAAAVVGVAAVIATAVWIMAPH